MEIETGYYLEKFQKAADLLGRQENFSQQKLECKAGIWLDSIVLKIQKRSWINNSPTAKPFGESVFFSIWLNDVSLDKGRLCYNIHALKLRQLTAYSIQSRAFADAFRLKFKSFEKEWPNVSVNFGPLTLMEGSVCIDEEHPEDIIIGLANRFSEIAFIIDDLLEERKKNKTA